MTNLLSPNDVGQMLGLKYSTLAKMRTERDLSLPWVKVGHLVRYKLEDVQAFIERNTVGKQEALQND